METSGMALESPAVEEDAVVNLCVERVDVAEDLTRSSLDTILEIGIENGYRGSSGSQSDVISLNSKISVDELPEPSVPTALDKDITALISEFDASDHAHGILDEGTVSIGSQGGTTRNLTLEEATDTILFCSSIVQNLAHEAATIAMEKENSVPLENFRPTATILGNSISNRMEPRGRTVQKHTSRSQKTRQRRVETDTKPPTNTVGDDKTDVSATHEGTVSIGSQGGTTRNLTLEEATDTILFCSSIVQNLAHEAATIAMEKENSVPLENSRPTATILGNSISNRMEPRGRTVQKHTSRSQKTRQRRVETDTKPPTNTVGDDKTDVSATRIVGVPNKGDNMKPPKLESKCNCTIIEDVNSNLIIQSQGYSLDEGTFKLTLQFIEDYPNKPPTVGFISQMFQANSLVSQVSKSVSI
ncbi:unnamed protein product [Ilex paraguariensis]|uniref:UBC core domain-containing protein n=1 Tax=Ilex paraguariensis TaxID=185542 RepID=A0ABC8SIE3_9AQUA